MKATEYKPSLIRMQGQIKPTQGTTTVANVIFPTAPGAGYSREPYAHWRTRCAPSHAALPLCCHWPRWRTGRALCVSRLAGSISYSRHPRSPCAKLLCHLARLPRARTWFPPSHRNFAPRSNPPNAPRTSHAGTTCTTTISSGGLRRVCRRRSFSTTTCVLPASPPPNHPSLSWHRSRSDTDVRRFMIRASLAPRRVLCDVLNETTRDEHTRIACLYNVCED